MASNNKAKEAYCEDSIYHTELTEDWLARERGYYMAHYAKSGKDEDIYFRMAEESEEVLEEERIATNGAIIEASTEVSISEEHSNTTSKDWDSEKKKDSSNEDSSTEERNIIEGQARSTHIQDRSNEVNCTKDRTETREVKA